MPKPDSFIDSPSDGSLPGDFVVSFEGSSWQVTRTGHATRTFPTLQLAVEISKQVAAHARVDVLWFDRDGNPQGHWRSRPDVAPSASGYALFRLRTLLAPLLRRGTKAPSPAAPHSTAPHAAAPHPAAPDTIAFAKEMP